MYEEMNHRGSKVFSHFGAKSKKKNNIGSGKKNLIYAPNSGEELICKSIIEFFKV